jgi:chemotaxis protein methyltransferase CheR
MTESLRRIAEVVREESGILLKSSQLPSLRAAVQRACGGDPDGFLALTADRRTASTAVAQLLDEVAVKETSFLRDRRQFDALDWRALLASAKACGAERVRVWSAGCATGEEAYTLAMLAAESFGSFQPPVSILGTDLSVAALEHASAGRYGKRSVCAVSEALRRRYFELHGEGLVVGPELRPLVSFAPHNLVRDGAPPVGQDRFDLIVCRNVLIYFEPETVNRVVESLEVALRPGGTLLLGAADALCGTARGYGVVAAATGAAVERRRAQTEATKPRRRFEDRLSAAVTSADLGRTDEAVDAVDELLRERPLDAIAHYLRGMLALERAKPQMAVDCFRRALSVDPLFGLSAFKLGRAYESLGDTAAARSAYEQALRAPDEGGGDRYAALLAQVDFVDIVAACRSRLTALE